MLKDQKAEIKMLRLFIGRAIRTNGRQLGFTTERFALIRVV